MAMRMKYNCMEYIRSSVQGIMTQYKLLQIKLALPTKITPHLQLARLFNISSHFKTNPKVVD